ncbi:MAG: sensor domain-containing diguanylate cyclase [Candidatus Sulfobium sp.]
MVKPDEFYKDLLDNLYDGVYFVDPDRVIKYWNKSAELLTGYSSSEIVGKPCWNNILMHVDLQGKNLCRGLCPLAKAMKEDRLLEQEVYLRHKEGHRVPVMVRVSPIKDGEGLIIGAVEIFSSNARRIVLSQRIEQLQRLALLDPLTEIGNRRYADLTLHARLDEFYRYDWKFGVLFMDIDYFKKINDLYGPEMGDKLLRMIARTLQNGVRSSDVVCRWGGEEFVALIANIDEVALGSLAEKLRRLVEQSKPFFEDEFIDVTISIGASISRMNDTPEVLIKRADDLMYRAKLSGRNSVIIE